MLGDSRNELYLRRSPVGNHRDQIELDVEFRAEGSHLKNLHDNNFKLMGGLGFGGLVANEASIAWLFNHGLSRSGGSKNVAGHNRNRCGIHPVGKDQTPRNRRYQGSSNSPQ